MGEEWSLDDVILIHRIADSWNEKWKGISDRFHRQTGRRKLASRWRTFPFITFRVVFCSCYWFHVGWKAARRRICLWDAFVRFLCVSFSFCYSFLSVRVLDHWNLFARLGMTVSRNEGFWSLCHIPYCFNEGYHSSYYYRKTQLLGLSHESMIQE